MTSPPRRQSFSQFAGIARSDSHSAGSIIIICKRYAPLGPHTQSPAQVPSGNNKNWLHRIKHRLSTFVKIVGAASLDCSLRAATNGDPLLTDLRDRWGVPGRGWSYRRATKPGSATPGGPIINAFRVTAQNGINFSNAHQTVDSSGYPVTEYIRHSLSREGKLTVRASKRGRAGQDHEPGGIGLRTAGRREVRLEIGMRLEPFLAASECDRYPIRHAPMTISIGLHYLRSASDQDAQFVRAHRCLRTSMDSGANAVRAAPRSLPLIRI